MPGSIELVHPNKFLPSNFETSKLILSIDLRPIEEFRHTPIIPISEKDMAEHKKKIDDANRKGYYVEIKKDTLYFYRMLYMLTACNFALYSDCDPLSGNDRLRLHDDERTDHVYKKETRPHEDVKAQG